MFEVRWTDRAARDYGTLKAAADAARAKRKKSGKKKGNKATKAEGLLKRVLKTVRLLRQNPRHPGLQTHEYHSLVNPLDRSQKVFEAYVQQDTPGAYRLFWCYGPGKRDITLIAITPHP